MNNILKKWFVVVAASGYLIGCSSGDVARVARGAATGNVGSLEQIAVDKAIGYATNPKALERDIKNFNKLLGEFEKIIGGVWGDQEVEIPEPKTYVKYTQNYLSRASVDFDRGTVTVETVDEEKPLESLKTAIVTTVLTPEDPRAVDLYSAKPIKLGETPFLFEEIKDAEGKFIRWSWRAEKFADWLIANRLEKREIEAKTGSKTVYFVRFDMVPDHLEIRARKYNPLVEKFAGEYEISRNLVFAVMKTESDFNPFAVSTAPAFGLMQIVPETAGQDVYRFLNRKAGLPTKQFLFEPANNIQYGTVYLHILDRNYLSAINHPVSREYCTITAYNAGAGNVLKTFDSNREQAVATINRMDPLEVYDTLRTRISSREARRYLEKVLEAKKDFINF